jgi:CDP-diacylglycerol--glycerol-3-phosphate 3-phosphatidyltransferase
MATSFGPSALVTPANAVTIARLAVTPVLLSMIIEGGDSYSATLLWILLAATDGVDGYLARRQGTTRSGAFLDPLADKVLVLGAMIALVAADRFSWVPVAIITAREITIQMLRTYWGRRGLAIQARYWAKVKTVVQEVAVGFALLPLTAENHPEVANAVLWIAVVLTVVTGIQYVTEGSRSATPMARE